MSSQIPPYAAPGQPPGMPPYGAPPKKSGGMGMVLIIVGVVVVLLLVCCGGGGYFLFNFGMNTITAGAKDSLAGNAVIQEHIGEISTLEFDFGKTTELNKPETFVFNIEGSKGSGTVEAHCVQNGDTFDVESGTLTMSTGEEYDLFGPAQVDLPAAEAPMY